ncbi:unnamed protein product, partial [Polarella glacialis]
MASGPNWNGRATPGYGPQSGTGFGQNWQRSQPGGMASPGMIGGYRQPGQQLRQVPAPVGGQAAPWLTTPETAAFSAEQLAAGAGVGAVDAAAGAEPAAAGGTSFMRRKMALDNLRLRRAAKRSDDLPHLVPRKPWQTLVAEERGWVKPLLLGAQGWGRRLASQLHASFSRVLYLFGEPEAFLEPMFHALNEDEDSGGRGVEADWRPSEDGLFRVSSGIHVTEPWNRERLHLQLERSVLQQPPLFGAGAGLPEAKEFSEFHADEEFEVLGCSLSAPRLLGSFSGASSWIPALGLRARSHFRSKRRQLFSGQMYELRIDVSRVTLFRVPLAGSSMKNGRPGPLEALDSREGRTAAELQELFHRYRQETDGDLTSQLDNRLDALVEYGDVLRRNVVEEDARRMAEQEVAAKGVAREAYRFHLEERQKMRAKRDEREQNLENISRNLYSKWRELRQVRQDYGFTSTPWRMRAHPEDHDVVVDSDRRTRNLIAEVDELMNLQGLHA